MFPGPEQTGTHPMLAHGRALASLWPCAQQPQHPCMDLLGFTHIHVTSPAQSPSALQALGTDPAGGGGMGQSAEADSCQQWASSSLLRWSHSAVGLSPAQRERELETAHARSP